MTKRVVALAGVLCLAAAVLAAADEPSDANWQTLVDGTYKFVLRCPAELMPTPDYEIADAMARYNPHAFLLTVGGGESNTAQQMCKADAEHVVQPFGTNPTIRPLKVQGQSACLVWPSSDQHKITGDDRALVTVKYPEPIEIGGTAYSFLMLYADKKNIMAMIRNLKFLAPDPQNAPFLMEIAFENGGSSDRAAKVGSPVVATVTLKNNSGQLLHLPFSDPTTDYHFNVSHERWGRTAVTGKYQELERQHKTAPSAAEPLTLGPHAGYQTKLEISSLYQLQNPGNYTIQGQMKLPGLLGAGLVNSNTLTVTVVASQDGEPQQRRPHTQQPPAASPQN